MSGPDAAITDGQPPPAEHDIDEALVRGLLEAQQPDLAELPLAYVTDGWVDIPVDVADSWLHSDLHPKNLVGDGHGRLAGVIDWGDLCAGDPATDLAAAWMLFPVEAHDSVWAAYGPISPTTLARARGWAVFFGTVLLDTAVDGADPFGRIGRETLERVVDP